MSLKLGEMLVANKVLTETQLKTALNTQKELGAKLGAILIKHRFVTEDQLAKFLGEQLNIPVLELKDLVVQTEVSGLVDLEILEKFQILPIRKDKEALLVAAVDPTDLDGLDDLHFLTGLRIDAVAVARSNLMKAIGYYFHGQPCPEIQEAEKALGKKRKGQTLPRPSGFRASPPKVVQALTELLIEKKVITQEELLAKLEVRDGVKA